MVQDIMDRDPDLESLDPDLDHVKIWNPESSVQDPDPESSPATAGQKI